MLADDVHNQLPPLEKDMFWGQSNPVLPHTKASLKKRDVVFEGHLNEMRFDDDEMVLVRSAGRNADDHDDSGERDRITGAAPLRRFQNLARLVRGKKDERVGAETKPKDQQDAPNA
uniref:Uncharacterized protein n=1 Tax=Romanomermis culicivorax TaxID=13658 RepID=A0A915JGG6_ROMCU